MNRTLSTAVAALALVVGCGKSPTAPPPSMSSQGGSAAVVVDALRSVLRRRR
jgi:hypothetical protein